MGGIRTQANEARQAYLYRKGGATISEIGQLMGRSSSHVYRLLGLSPNGETQEAPARRAEQHEDRQYTVRTYRFYLSGFREIKATTYAQAVEHFINLKYREEDVERITKVVKKKKPLAALPSGEQSG